MNIKAHAEASSRTGQAHGQGQAQSLRGSRDIPQNRNHAKLSTESPDKQKQADQESHQGMTILHEEEGNNKPIVNPIIFGASPNVVKQE